MNIRELISRLENYARLDNSMEVKIVMHNTNGHEDRGVRYCDINKNSINTVRLCPTGYRVEINVHTDFEKEVKCKNED